MPDAAQHLRGQRAGALLDSASVPSEYDPAECRACRTSRSVRNTHAEAVQITIASALSFNGAARMASYSASKAAAMSFHESLRAELIHESVLPGAETALTRAATMHRTSAPPSSAPASSRPASSTSSTTTPPSSTSSPRPWPRTTSSRTSSTPSTPRSRAPFASHTTSTCFGPSAARPPGSGTLSNGWVRCLIMRLRLIFFRAVWQL
jgi:NAD(P)-dependent dehydrogenase (short-subunit alcohol dehydrogenase family)